MEIKDKIEIPSIGVVTLNDNKNKYLGKGNWCDKIIPIQFLVDNLDKIDKSILTANTLWKSQLDWNKKIYNTILIDLLKLKNECWLEDDEKPISTDQLVQNIKLKSLIFYEDGDFQFWFDDGDIFWGHSIEVSGSIKKGIEGATLQE